MKYFLNIKIFILNLIGRTLDKFIVSPGKKYTARLIVATFRPTTIEECKGIMTDKKFRWTIDPIKGLLDYTSEPWFTLIKKGGDCEDLALFWSYMCSDYPSVMFSVHSEASVHAMTCLRVDGKYYIASNLNIDLIIDPKDENIINDHGEIKDFEDAIILASKIICEGCADKVRVLSPNGYIKKTINITKQ